MQQITLVNDRPLQVKEWQGRRVVTFRDIDSLHQRPDGTASRNFRKNRKHFIPGEDFCTLEPDEIRRAGFERPQGGYAEEMHLITESGYLMLVKSFKDDLAWNVQRALVNSYFRGKINPPPRGFLEACGVIRHAPPEPTPQEVATRFLQAIGAALASGEYSLRPVGGRETDGQRLLGYYTNDAIIIKAGTACAIYAEAVGRAGELISVGKKLWPVLIAAGLCGSICRRRFAGRSVPVRVLDRRSVDRLCAAAPSLCFPA